MVFENKIISILGAGQLGKELYESIKDDYKVRLFSHNDFDICDISNLSKIVASSDVIINCVANINADKIETSDRYISFNVNYLSVKNLAILCKNYKKKLIHISSDYVYGSNDIVEKLTEEYDCHPINQYGIDKLASEKAIIDESLNNYLILRVAWLFGKYGNQNFIEKIKQKLASESEMKCVDDQVGNITSVPSVIKVVLAYLKGRIPNGIYNVQNNDEVVSRYDIACYIKECLGNTTCKIIPCRTFDYKLPAQRQLNSNLDTTKIRKYVELPKWKDEIKAYLNEKPS